MIVKSYRFGDVEVADDSVLTFPKGILGFEDERRFVVLRCEQTEPVSWLHSLENEYVALPIISPFMLMNDYSVEVDDSELHVIDTNDENDIAVVCVVVLPEALEDMTANLMAPILVNTEKKYGLQIIMDDKSELMRYPAYEGVLKFYESEAAGNVGTDSKG